MDSVFRSLRSSRHGQRFNFWTNDNQQSGGSGASALPQGFEDLLVSHLRRPSPEKSADQDATEGSQNRGEATQFAGSGETAAESAVENNNDNEARDASAPSAVLDESGGANVTSAAIVSSRGTDAPNSQSQPVEMQFEQNDVAIRDVEAVSQESSGSGATLGESLRSLDVEIGSADGHDDGGDRQGSADARIRRTNVSFGNSTQVSARDVALHSVSEASEHPNQEAEQTGPSEEQQRNVDADSGSIDPAFLEALPEELRAEVLSAQQGQATQPQNSEPQNGGDIDPEFLAALPADIREEVLAQQRAQRLQQSQELEGQPVEMDTVSIIATFPSELREEVFL